MAKVVQAFIARSFANEDVSRIQPLLDFLETFETIGFVCIDAEPAEAEQVSKKVQGLIRESDVFIGFFTKKHPIAAKGSNGALDFVSNSSSAWSAPAWVLQESGFALGLDRKLVFYVEDGVEIPQLQGDHERIHFSIQDFGPAFKRTNEMVHKIISRHLDLKVTTVIERETSVQSPAVEASIQVATELPKESAIIPFVMKIFDGIKAGNEELQQEGYIGGLELTIEHGTLGELGWKCFFHRERAIAGYTYSLTELKELETTNPGSNEPLLALGNVLENFGEHLEAASYFNRAADKVDPESSVSFLLRGAECLIRAKQFVQARNTLLRAMQIALEKQKPNLLKKIYDTYNEEGDTERAIGVAEYSLSQNVAQPDLHFSIAFDHSNDFQDLAIFHYGMVLDQRSEDSGAMNNLAVDYASLNMPIKAVELYKRAATSGNSLAAGNLGFQYLNAGFASEARKVIEGFLTEETPEPRVTQCFDALEKNKRAEDEKHKKVREAADEQRSFFKVLGDALVNPISFDPTGTWTFPSCDMRISVEEGKLKGVGSAPRYGTFSAMMSGQPQGTDTYVIEGDLDRTMCSYELTFTTSKKQSLFLQPQISQPTTVYRSAKMVFLNDGQNGIVLEKDGNLRKVFRIKRAIVGLTAANSKRE